MKYIEFYNKFHYLGAFALKDITLLEPSVSRFALHRRNKTGYLLSVSPGVWVFQQSLKNQNLESLVANILYSPSYLSLEWALQYYNIIPEGVFMYTSVSPKKTKIFQTTIGTYKYQSLTPKLYRGYTIVEVGNYKIALATIEKTVLDYLYFHPDLDTDTAFEEWRINSEELRAQRDEKKFLEWSQRYNKPTQQRARSLVSYINNNA